PAGEILRPGHQRREAPRLEPAVQAQGDVQRDVLLVDHRPPVAVEAGRQPGERTGRKHALRAGVLAAVAGVDGDGRARQRSGRGGKAECRERRGEGEPPHGAVAPRSGKSRRVSGALRSYCEPGRSGILPATVRSTAWTPGTAVAV